MSDLRQRPLGGMGNDPFAPVLAEVAPQKKTSRRASRRARAPGPSPAEADDDLDLRLSFLPTHDPANAKRLTERFGEDMAYVDDNGWMIYNGVRWVGGNVGAAGAFNFAAQICDLILKEVKALEKAIAKDASIGSQARVDKLLGWGEQSGTVARINAMLKCAQNKMRKDISEFDRDPWLVPSLNGTLVLGKKTLFRENRREDYCTKAVAVEYQPMALSPLFGKFFARIMPAKDMRDFVMRSLGYSLTGSVREHVLFIWHGPGRNGKSTLMENVRHIFGSYGASTPVEMLLRGNDKSGSEATPEIARLPGVRLVVADEPQENAKLNESRTKKLTGGDRIEARKLFADLFEFKPSFKITLLTNYAPHVYGVDEGIWRRLMLIRFNEQIPMGEVDLDLSDKLKEEASGVLNLIIAGAEDYFEQGLAPPEAAIEAGKEDDWINPDTNRSWETKFGDLREVYLKWCQGECREPMSATTFGSKLQAHGIKRRISNGNTYYQIWIPPAAND